MFGFRSRYKDLTQPAAPAKPAPEASHGVSQIKPFRPPSPPSQPTKSGPEATATSHGTNGRGESDRLLLVGRNTQVAVEIKNCDRLIVEGKVEGKLVDSGVLEVAESGHFHGTAVVERCTVAGNFEGDLTVRGVLRLRPTGRVSGTTRYGEIEVDRGGTVTGAIEFVRPSTGSARLRPASEAGSVKQAGGKTARPRRA